MDGRTRFIQKEWRHDASVSRQTRRQRARNRGHSRPQVYDAGAASDAWAKTLAFLRRELKA
jgi:dienelactone hydrolase